MLIKVITNHLDTNKKSQRPLSEYIGWLGLSNDWKPATPDHASRRASPEYGISFQAILHRRGSISSTTHPFNQRGLGHDTVALFVLRDSQVQGDLLVHALVCSPPRKSFHAAASPFSEMHYFAWNDLDATVQCTCSIGGLLFGPA